MAASTLLQQILSVTAIVGFAAANPPGRGVQPGSAASAMALGSWLLAVVGVAAILLVALASMLHRRRTRREDSIPFIIDLEALSASAGASDSQPTASAVRPPTPPEPPQAQAIQSDAPEAGGRPAESPSSSPLFDRSSLITPPTNGSTHAARDRGERRLEVEALFPSPASPAGNMGRSEEAGLRSGRESPLQAIMPRLSVSRHTGAQESLQLLPGTLEVVEGTVDTAPIRFFRTAALEVPEVTLGRSDGPPYRHIHLRAPSVSRLHARMRFEAGRWTILNLSRTNPLRVNGVILDAMGIGCILSDGDRIQLGEVVLRYREQRV